MAFKKGQTGNPNGRPKGVRDKVTNAFLNDLEKDWRENGAAALKQAREQSPAVYVKMVASLVPKDLNVNHNRELNELSLAELKEHVSGLIGQVGGGGIGADAEDSGEPTPDSVH